MKRRIICLYVVILIFLSILIGRLGFIQLFDGGKYGNMAEKQNRTNIAGIWARGTIYDRNNQPLINEGQNYYFLINESRIDAKAEKLLQGFGKPLPRDSNVKYRTYALDTLTSTEYKKLCRDYGAIAVKSPRRYSEDQRAIHIIGLVNDDSQSGMWGIEKDFEKILSSGKLDFSFQNDGQGYVVYGKGAEVGSDRRQWGVITTLDRDFQDLAEKTLNSMGESGAIVITDIIKGEILASASAPSFNPYDFDNNDRNNELTINKATEKTYPSEILYRTIESNLLPEYKNTLTDKDRAINDMIKTLGLNGEAVINLSGQALGGFNEDDQTLYISPIEAARFVRIIALEGMDRPLRLIKGTMEGIRGVSLQPALSQRQVIPSELAKSMAISMEAKSMIKTDNEKEFSFSVIESTKAGHWFFGYTPKINPKYGVTIFVEKDAQREVGTWFSKIGATEAIPYSVFMKLLITDLEKLPSAS